MIRVLYGTSLALGVLAVVLGLAAYREASRSVSMTVTMLVISAVALSVSMIVFLIPSAIVAPPADDA